MKKRLLVLLVFLTFILGCGTSEIQNVKESIEVEEVHLQEDEFYNENNQKKCSEPVTFNFPPVDLDQIDWIVPLGLMSGNHVTPVDHQYYQASHDNQIEVINPGKGIITTN